MEDGVPVTWEDVNPKVQQAIVQRLRRSTQSSVEEREDAVSEAAFKIVRLGQPAKDVNALLFASATNILRQKRHIELGHPRHVTIDPVGQELRFDRQHHNPSLAETLASAEGYDPAAIVGDGEERARQIDLINKTMSRLSPRDQFVIKRCVMDSASVEDVARELDISKRVVSVTAYRARCRLEQLMKIRFSKTDRFR